MEHVKRICAIYLKREYYDTSNVHLKRIILLKRMYHDTSKENMHGTSKENVLRYV